MNNEVKLSDIKKMVAENKIYMDRLIQFTRMLERGSTNNVVDISMPVPAKIRSKISLAYLESAEVFDKAVTTNAEQQMPFVQQGIAILDSLWENMFQEAVASISEEKMINLYSNMVDIITDKTHQVQEMKDWAEGFIFIYEMKKKLDRSKVA